MANSTRDKLPSLANFWQLHAQSGTFKGTDNISIAYVSVVHPEPKGHIVICNGRIESYLKYQEVIADLYQQGFSCYALDHRGQGLSQRLCKNHQKGFVKDFSHYVDDLHQFIEKVVLPVSQTQPHLLCHSMGSAIGALYLIKYPSVFKSTIFCAPMFGIASALNPTFAHWLINQVCQLNSYFNREPWYFFGQSNYLPVPFRLNQLTHCKLRYQWFKNLYNEHTSLQLGGVTAGWLKAAIDAMETIKHRAQDIHQPVLVLQAEKDVIVDNSEQDMVCQQLPQCQKIVVTGAKHEVLMETDDKRSLVMSTMLDFFNANQSN